MAVATTTKAETRASAAGHRGTGRPRPPETHRVHNVALKCTAAYKDWVLRMARLARCTESDLVDKALVAYAPTLGLTEEPPVR